MFLKSINNVIGYKDLPDGFCAEFDEKKTYIVGANFQRKSTVGSIFNWCMTGTSLNGKEKESVANDTKKNKKVIVDITFIDNFGIEHILVREKGKEIHLTLDGKEIEQEYLTQFYKNKDIFLVIYNPYYFWTLEPKEQKDLIRKILPSVDAKDIFNMLTESEQNLIENPIDNLNSYNDEKNEEIDLLKKEYNTNNGRIETLKRIALEKEGDLLEFNKEEELAKLQKQFDEISMDFDNYNLENITISIESLDRRIKNIIDEDLSKISKQYERENNKLKEAEKEKAICSYCRQEIKDEEAKLAFKQFIKKEMDKLQEKADKLKDDAKKLIACKKEKQIIFDKLNTPDMKQLQAEKESLKRKIDELQKEKNEILFHNQEVKIRMENVRNAKETLENCEKAQLEIEQKLENAREQKKIINKLRVLTIEAQKEKIEKHLNKVNIEFSKIVKTTGEITECCNIQYEGRDYKKLSKSQQARACLEISNVFNNISGIKAPIFFDDAESTTDIPEIPGTQLIISLVIKYNKLEFLYDYEDVLERREKSIKREIEEKDCYEISIAA